MKILLVEDDPNKRDKISVFIKNSFPGVDLSQTHSYNAGFNAVLSGNFSLVLLDMSLPIYDISPEEDGYDVDAYAGRFLLAEMDRMSIRTPVVIITQFDTFGEGSEFKTLTQLDSQLHEEFPAIYRGSIFYSPAEENWKSKLEKVLKEL